MSGLFSSMKAPKAPALPAPAAMPQDTGQAGEDESKKIRSQQGYEKQILAGSLAPTPTGKKTKLGGY
jgi:hypothetical protein